MAEQIIRGRFVDRAMLKRIAARKARRCAKRDPEGAPRRPQYEGRPDGDGGHA